MKPYGREKNITSGRVWKIDNHIHEKGYVNWWENMCDFLTRGSMKHIQKREINKEINDNWYENR